MKTNRTMQTMTAAGLTIVTISAVALMAVVGAGSGPAAAQGGGTPTATPAADQLAANNGPIVGVQAAFPTEEACMQSYAKNPANNYQGFYPALGAAEHTDSIRSGVFPCATWTGVYTVTGAYSTTNQVYAYPSEDSYPLTNFMNFMGSNIAVLSGGGLASGCCTSGIYVAGFDPSTGRQRWRTYLNNYAIGDVWNAFAAQSITDDGVLLVVSGVQAFRIDPNNGHILATAELPVIGSPPDANNWDGLMPAPDGLGTWIAKTQTRAVPCADEGNLAMSSCVPQPNTTVVAFNGKTLQVYDAIELPQPVIGRNAVVKYKGKIYQYTGGSTSIFRVEWNPQTKKLTLDNSWNPTYTQPGQTGGTATVLLNDWVIQNTNSLPANTPQCIVAVSQADASKLTRICPFGDIPKGFVSNTPGSPGIDAENSMIVAQDVGIGGVYGIKLDQSTGEMSIAWSRPDWRSSDYFSFVGPKDQRVVISQNLLNIKSYPEILSAKYQETLLWASLATGKTIAESSPHNSTALGSLPNVGSGGRVYTMGNNGTSWIYQVGPYQTPVPTNTPAPTPTPKS
jgi:hypothetical protein